MRINKIIAGALSLSLLNVPATKLYTYTVANAEDLSTEFVEYEEYISVESSESIDGEIDISTPPIYEEDTSSSNSIENYNSSFGIYYTVDDNGNALVTRLGNELYTSQIVHIIIPEEIDGFIITGISNDAFTGFIDPSAIISIDILAPLKEIPNNMFDGLTNLEEFYIKSPKSLIKIGDNAFRDCENLYSTFYKSEVDNTINLPNLKEIGDNAFKNCTKFKETLNIPSTVSIGNHAFEGSGIKNITLPDSLEYLGEYSFYNCPLENVIINGKFDTIPKYAFASTGNNSLYLNLKILADIKYIDEGAFNGSTLLGLKLSEGVEVIGDSAFASCSLKELSLPTTLKTIGDNTFSDNIITQLTIPNGVETIGRYAFEYNPTLQFVNIPSSVSRIGDNAFMFTFLERSSNSLPCKLILKNPNCEISNLGLIYNDDWKILSDLRLVGYKNSTLQEYANLYNIPFEDIKEQNTTTSTPSNNTLYGDTNCDGEVSISDAVLIMQTLVNPTEYVISEQGKLNGDVLDSDGITAADSLVIQCIEANIVSENSLPITMNQLNAIMKNSNN